MVILGTSIKWNKTNFPNGNNFELGLAGEWEIFHLIDNLSNSTKILKCKMPGLDRAYYLNDIEDPYLKAEEVLKNWLDKAGFTGAA